MAGVAVDQEEGAAEVEVGQEEGAAEVVVKEVLRDGPNRM